VWQDAFDLTDTQQSFIYWDRLTKCGDPKTEARLKEKTWLKRQKESEASDLKGSFIIDLSLWFMLAGSFAGFTGVVNHADVIHSHAVVILWGVLHHQARMATSWRGTGYLHTLFSPSATLLPLEYCLNLADQEMVGDDAVEDLEKWRKFVKKECGVELTIEY